MRTLPTAITTGLTNKLRMFYLVKLEGSVNTYYWTTASKNFDATPRTLILKATAGGATLTYDVDMIAKAVYEGGTVMEYDGIGAMESSVDISMGGSIAQVSDLTIDVLNQERFDETILAAENLENRPVSVYLGFVPTGVSPTVVIADDMLLMWKGVVEDVMDYDYGYFSLRCTDGTYLNHRDIPLTVIERDTFTNAPKESLGLPIPILYGDFSVDVSSASDLYNELASPAPCVKTHEQLGIFYVSSELCYDAGFPFVYSDSNNLFGDVRVEYNSTGVLYRYPTVSLPATNPTNGASGCYVQMAKNGWGNVFAYFYQIPKYIGSGTTTTISDDDFVKMIDGDEDTSYTLGLGKSVYFKPVQMSAPGEPVGWSGTKYTQEDAYITLIIDFGTITGDDGQIWYRNTETGISYEYNPGSGIDASTYSNTTYTENFFAAYPPAETPDYSTFDNVAKYEYGIYANTSTLIIKNVYILYLVRLNSFGVRTRYIDPKKVNYIGQDI